MHGFILFFIQKYAESVAGGPQAWARFRSGINTSTQSYSPVGIYPDSDATNLLEGVSRMTNRPLDETMTAFGEYLAPQMIKFGSKLIRSEWRTLELIANTEDVIHTFVRQSNPGAEPPVLQCMQNSEDELHLIYGSARQMCALAKGIVRGVASYFGETIDVVETSCMLRGNPFCTLEIRRRRDIETVIFDEATIVGPPVVSEHTPTERTPSPAPPSAPRAFAPAGTTIGRYRIVDFLGQGNMGQVYLAEDLDLGRRVALKIAHPHLARDPDTRRRFLREARAAAAVQHDNLATIYQVGQNEDLVFMAMQHLEGQTLEEWLAEVGRPPLADALRIGREIATGLAAAHRQGLVHRDIKPDNVWLESVGRRAKILDFGAARSIVEDPETTHPGTMIGTPAYMSPEQAAGESCDARSDLFSLGVILYRLLGGALPFQGTSLIAVLTAIVEANPQPLEELAPDLPRCVCAIVGRLMARNQDERPRDAEAVVEVIKVCEADLSAV